MKKNFEIVPKLKFVVGLNFYQYFPQIENDNPITKLQTDSILFWKLPANPLFSLIE